MLELKLLCLRSTATKNSTGLCARLTDLAAQGNKVLMYVCGVTVYDYSHIGALRRTCVPAPARFIFSSTFVAGEPSTHTRS